MFEVTREELLTAQTTEREAEDELRRLVLVPEERDGWARSLLPVTEPVPPQPIPNTEPLRAFFLERVRPYLLEGDHSDSPLRYPARSLGFFRNLRTLLPPGAHDAVAALENACDQRRELDRQARVHFWLHNWLWFHLPLAAAMTVLMIIHIVVAIQYW